MSVQVRVENYSLIHEVAQQSSFAKMAKSKLFTGCSA